MIELHKIYLPTHYKLFKNIHNLKYKRIRYKGIICDRCGVEVTQKSVRRERMGHIGLAVPVVHIWFFRAQPSKIGNIIGLSLKELEKVIYYESYIVLNPGPTGLKKGDLISEDQYFEVMSSLPAENQKFEDTHEDKFVAKIGGDAVKTILKNTNVEKLSFDYGWTNRTYCEHVAGCLLYSSDNFIIFSIYVQHR